MKRIAFVLVALAAAVAGPGLQHMTSAQSDAELEQLARGRYLVEDVAQCIQCHSPRDTNGNLIQSKLLQGAPIPVTSPFPTKPFAERAPNLAGLAGFGAEGVKHLLTTGKVKRTGQPPSAPMPPFRMNNEDADSVVAYLVSLRKAS